MCNTWFIFSILIAQYIEYGTKYACLKHGIAVLFFCNITSFKRSHLLQFQIQGLNINKKLYCVCEKKLLPIDPEIT